MPSPLEAIASAITSAQCALLGANEYALGSLGRFGGPTRARAQDGLNAIRGLLGCDPANNPVAEPPFTGGQCDGQQYIGSYSGETGQESSPTPRTVFFKAIGPISGVVTSGSAGNQTTGLRCRGALQREGTPFTCGGIPPTAGELRVITFFSGGRQANFAIDSVSPCGLDNCGDPEPVFPPPTNITIDAPIIYNIENGPDIDLTVPIIYAPFEINLDGSIRVPFNFDFGGVNFTGDLNFSPEATVNFNPPSINPGDGEGTDDLPPGDPADEVEPKDPAEKIIRVVVVATEINSQQVSSILAPNIPPIFIPRLGSVKFAYSFGATTFFSSDIDIKDRRTFIECPFPGGADAVIASPAVGVELDAIPISGFPLATVKDVART